MSDTTHKPPRGGRWRLVGWGGAAALLAGLAAMQAAGRMDWGPADFALAAGLMVGVGVAMEVAVRLSRDWTYRAAAAVALGTTFLLVWVNLAVGLIGSEDDAVNLMFFAVPVVAIVGAFTARFRPNGMAAALFATAAAQALVTVGAFAAGRGFEPATLMFVALWLVSAGLFRKAATARVPR